MIARIDHAGDAAKVGLTMQPSRTAYLWQSNCGDSFNGSLTDLGYRPPTQGASLAGRRRACMALLQPSPLHAGAASDSRFPLEITLQGSDRSAKKLSVREQYKKELLNRPRRLPCSNKRKMYQSLLQPLHYTSSRQTGSHSARRYDRWSGRCCTDKPSGRGTINRAQTHLFFWFARRLQWEVGGHDNSQRRHTHLLQRLGCWAACCLLAWMAVERGCLGRTDAVPGSTRLSCGSRTTGADTDALDNRVAAMT
jgi:hypothetical protein